MDPHLLLEVQFKNSTVLQTYMRAVEKFYSPVPHLPQRDGLVDVSHSKLLEARPQKRLSHCVKPCTQTLSMIPGPIF